MIRYLCFISQRRNSIEFLPLILRLCILGVLLLVKIIMVILLQIIFMKPILIVMAIVKMIIVIMSIEQVQMYMSHIIFVYAFLF